MVHLPVPLRTSPAADSIPFIHTGLELSLLIAFVIALSVGFEALALRKRNVNYDFRETAASVVLSLGHHTAGLLAAFLWGGLMSIAWQHRLWTVPLDTWWGLLLLFVGEEFFYYWGHRFCHQMPWFWASHAVHHSPRQVNFATAIRFGWTENVMGLGLVFAPMILFGFSPEAVFTMVGANLIYQVWVHTELVPKLGFLDLVLNTPYNHRMHHSRSRAVADRNYGGVLMVYDHLFGTYLKEHPKEHAGYGVPGMTRTASPWAVLTHEWKRVLRQTFAQPGIGSGLRYLFGIGG